MFCISLRSLVTNSPYFLEASTHHVCVTHISRRTGLTPYEPYGVGTAVPSCGWRSKTPSGPAGDGSARKPHPGQSHSGNVLRAPGTAPLVTTPPPLANSTSPSLERSRTSRAVSSGPVQHSRWQLRRHPHSLSRHRGRCKDIFKVGNIFTHYPNVQNPEMPNASDLAVWLSVFFVTSLHRLFCKTSIWEAPIWTLPQNYSCAIQGHKVLKLVPCCLFLLFFYFLKKKKTHKIWLVAILFLYVPIFLSFTFGFWVTDAISKPVSFCKVREGVSWYFS